MIRRSKLLICTLAMSMVLTVLPGMTSIAAEAEGETQAAASELQDENSQRLEEVTAMDEEGNIYEIGESDGTVAEEEPQETEDTTRFRSRSTELKVVNLNTKSVSQNTEYYDSKGNEGYTNGHYGADAAYLGTTSSGKIRFMLAGVTGTVSASEVQVLDYSSVAANVSYYKVSGGNLVHYISQNLNNSPASSINNGPAPSYLKEGTKYYSYDGHYFYTDFGTMTYDYQDGVRNNSVNADNKFTNYFQFFDMNQSTNYTAEELNSILNNTLKSKGKDSSSKLWNTGSIFVKQQNTYSVNALLSVAIAINESGWGTSNICQTKNNLFGLNAQDSNVGNALSFNSVESCIIDFMKNWMVGGYLKDGSWKNFGEYLGNKGGGINVQYASDPYWGEKAAAHAWTLDENGGSKDYLGIEGDTDDDSDDTVVEAPDDSGNTETPDTPGSGDSDVSENNPDVDDPSEDDTDTSVDEPSTGDSDTSTDKPSTGDSDTSTSKPGTGDSDTSTGKPSTGDSDTSTGKPSTGDSDTNTDKPSAGNSDTSTSKPSTGDSDTSTSKPGAGDSDTSTNKPSTGDSDTNTNKPSAGDSDTSTSKPSTGDSDTSTSKPGAGDSDTSTSKPSTGDSGTSTSKPSTGDSDTSTSKPSTGDSDTSTDKPSAGDSDTSTSKPSTGESDTSTSKPDAGDSETNTSKPSASKTDTSDTEKRVTVSGVSAEVEIIEPNTEKYESYVSADVLLGKTVLGVYNITPKETVNGKPEITFYVSSEYNGRNVIILHYLEDGSFEKYNGTVENGQVTISVKGFSPYVIALDDNGSDADTSKAPKTGDSANMTLWVVLLGLSAAAAVTVLARRRISR